MATRPRGSRWIADIRDKTGKRYRHTFQTKQEAQAWEAQAKLAMSQGKPLPATPSIIKKNPHMRDLNTLSGLFEYVFHTDWGNAKSSQTLGKNGKDVVAFFGHNKSPSSITSQGISQFKAYLAQERAKPATINRKLSALSKLLKVGYGMGLVDRMPLINWEREEKTKFRYLNEDEQGQLLDYWLDLYHIDMYEFCVFLLDTGARLSEALHVVYEQGNPSITFWKTKTGKPRTVPLTKRCLDILNQAMKTKPLLTQQASPRLQIFSHLSRAAIRRDWTKMQKDLNWPDVTPHTLRHTCCTRLVSRGVDIKRVMEWMGHSNITTTQRYMQISPQGLADVVHVLEQAKQEPIAA